MAKIKEKIEMVVEDAKKAVRDEAIAIEIEMVKLIGSEVEKLGDHLIIMSQGATLRFQNGLAKVNSRLAAKLRELGVVE